MYQGPTRAWSRRWPRRRQAIDHAAWTASAAVSPSPAIAKATLAIDALCSVMRRSKASSSPPAARPTVASATVTSSAAISFMERRCVPAAKCPRTDQQGGRHALAVRGGRQRHPRNGADRTGSMATAPPRPRPTAERVGDLTRPRAGCATGSMGASPTLVNERSANHLMSRRQPSGQDAAKAARSWSACSRRKTSGGRILRTLPCRPVVPIRTPRLRMPSTMSFAVVASGSVDAGADDLDADRQADLAHLADDRVRRGRRRAAGRPGTPPTSAAFAMIRSSSMTSSTASAAAIATGLPPNVLEELAVR